MLNSEQQNHHQNHHQIEIVDEFTIARIYRLWERWLQANLINGRNKHNFYRQAVNKTTGLEHLRLATVYILLARLDAARQQDAQHERNRLSGTPDTNADADVNAEAGPV